MLVSFPSLRAHVYHSLKHTHTHPHTYVKHITECSIRSNLSIVLITCWRVQIFCNKARLGELCARTLHLCLFFFCLFFAVSLAAESRYPVKQTRLFFESCRLEESITLFLLRRLSSCRSEAASDCWCSSVSILLIVID